MTEPTASSASPAPQLADCPQCLKPTDLCVCSEVTPVKSRIHVLILQHPQEPDKDLGSARLAHLSLPNSTLKIGLSWRNLSAALGREAHPLKWAVLYLGSGVKNGEKPGSPPHPIQLLTKTGTPLPDSEEVLSQIEGLVVLDGTWSQAKTLWWRNAWLLKLRRAVLTPKQPSLYKELRREPRRECLSTIESIGAALVALGEPISTGTELSGVFQKLLDRKRAQRKSQGRASSKPGSPPPALDPTQ